MAEGYLPVPQNMLPIIDGIPAKSYPGRKEAWRS